MALLRSAYKRKLSNISIVHKRFQSKKHFSDTLRNESKHINANNTYEGTGHILRHCIPHCVLISALDNALKQKRSDKDMIFNTITQYSYSPSNIVLGSKTQNKYDTRIENAIHNGISFSDLTRYFNEQNQNSCGKKTPIKEVIRKKREILRAFEQLPLSIPSELFPNTWQEVEKICLYAS